MPPRCRRARLASAAAAVARATEMAGVMTREVAATPPMVSEMVEAPAVMKTEGLASPG